MNTESYTVRVNPEGTSYYSYALAGAVEVDFAAALTAARRVFDSDSWRIIRMSDGVIIAHYDATGLDAVLWRNYRRAELAAQRRAEFLKQLEPKINGIEARLDLDIAKARADVQRRSTMHPTDRLWRTMRNIRLEQAIEEAVWS